MSCELKQFVLYIILSSMFVFGNGKLFFIFQTKQNKNQNIKRWVVISNVFNTSCKVNFTRKAKQKKFIFYFLQFSYRFTDFDSKTSVMFAKQTNWSVVVSLNLNTKKKIYIYL